ncbi:MAG TPA: APC family permease [Coxiellaceae bacterium]|nr:APC family permease [Coxiellaceae bacterium]
MTVGSVDSIRNLPTTALFGTSLVFFFGLAAICFLIPTALVSAELSSSSTESGGIYAWIKHAFGVQTGFVAVWFQWIENVIWYPTILSFVAGTIGYLVSPSLATNKFFLITVILIAFWGATLINLLGIRSSARFSSFCTVVGLLVPMSLIIILGGIWLVTERPIQIHFTYDALVPHFTDSHLWVALTGIILSFCGMEIATVHAGDVRDPQRSYPTAMLISCLVLLFTLMCGSLAIAIVLPANDISLVAGLMQAFHAFFAAYGMEWILPFIAFTLVVGGMGSVSNWIIAPTRGLLVASKDGNLPRFCRHENRYGAPKALLIVQAVIVSAITLVFLLLPSVNGSYWLLTALAAQLYMLMYVIMFTAAIRLRYKPAHTSWVKAFRIPGGNWGMCLVAGVGILASIATFFIGFIPPENINIGSVWRYESLLVVGLIVMSVPPFIMYRYCRKSN